jgi:adenylate kinase
MVEGRLQKDDIVANGCLLDGFPRTVPQAEALRDILKRTGHKMAAVVNIEADQQMLITRLTARRMCTNKECGAIFNVVSMPPKNEGICDKCGAKLYQRTDDTKEAALHRLDVYAKQTAPLIDFYKKEGKLVRSTSRDLPAEVNYANLKAALKA